MRLWRNAAASALIAVLAAGCGDSGGGAASPNSTSPPAPPAAATPVWTQNVFEPASRFENQCQSVRTGRDLEGNPFPDRQGSFLLEKFWLRSWTEETYLFNTEVVDRDPAEFNTPIAYFDVLRTLASTPSGRPKDEFHFSTPTAQFLQERNAVPTASYGAEFVILSRTPPRRAVVRFTEPSSPASALVGGAPVLRRGTEILQVDGIDLVNGAASQAEIDSLNNGLFPRTVGEVHTLVVRDPGGAPRTVTLTSAAIAARAVNRTSVIDTADGRVGYVLLNTFNTFASEQQIHDAVQAFRRDGVRDLVLDLRYNGGGLLAVASQLGFMTAGPARTTGRVFERLRFNANAGLQNPVTGQPNQPTPFYSTGLGFSLNNGAPLPSLDLGRVFILSTDETCSASESVLNGLRGIDVEVVLIGGRTCGKPFGFYPQDNCGATYFTIQFQGVNDRGFGDYADGFLPGDSTEPFGVRVPGCTVADDLSRELGDPQEALLAAALSYRSGGGCPPAAPVAFARAARPGAGGLALQGPQTSPITDILATNRNMAMP